MKLITPMAVIRRLGAERPRLDHLVGWCGLVDGKTGREANTKHEHVDAPQREAVMVSFLLGELCSCIMSDAIYAQSSWRFHCGSPDFPVMPRAPRALKVGTDFSGMDMPLFALRALERTGGIPPVRHLFSCDNAAPCRRFIEATHPAEHMFDNVESRDVAEVPKCDVYIWGPPCQSFSTSGRGAGVKDKRGVLSRFSLRYIKHHKPKLTIMDFGAQQRFAFTYNLRCG